MRKLLAAVLSMCSVCHADPWFTGPLLAPPAKTVARGHVNVFLDIGNAVTNAIYNSDWQRIAQPSTYTSTQINPQFYYGLTDNIDIQYNSLYQINQSSSASFEHLGDSSIMLGYQALSQSTNNALPDLRISIEEILPSGFYNRFSPINSGADATGMGSYQTSLGFNFQYLSQLNESHYLNSHFSVTYTHPQTTDIHGLSFYGGTTETRGKIDPGDAISFDWAGELTLTQNWVAVMEANFIYQQATNFKGVIGTGSTGDPTTSTGAHQLFPTTRNSKADIGNGSLDQFTLAPALEYNFSANYGVVAGVWFTVAGRNTPQFVTSLFQFTATW